MKQLRILFSALLLALTVYQSDGRAQMVINSYAFSGPLGYPLDQISTTSLVGAWSNRKLSTSYSGFANEVRRSSDNAASNVGFSEMDYDAVSLTAYVGANSGFIKTWYDQSGNGRNLTQATNSNQPRIRNSGTNDLINSRLTIKGSNTNQASLGGSIGSVSTTTLTIVVVLSVPAFVTGNRRVVSTNQSGNNDYGNSSTFNINQHTTNGIMVNQNTNLTTTLNANTPSVLTAIWNGSTLKIRINGTEVASASNTSTIIVNDIDFFGATFSYGDFSISECVMYSRALNSTELGIIEGNMGAYYGIF